MTTFHVGQRLGIEIREFPPEIPVTTSQHDSSLSWESFIDKLLAVEIEGDAGMELNGRNVKLFSDLVLYHL